MTIAENLCTARHRDAVRDRDAFVVTLHTDRARRAEGLWRSTRVMVVAQDRIIATPLVTQSTHDIFTEYRVRKERGAYFHAISTRLLRGPYFNDTICSFRTLDTGGDEFFANTMPGDAYNMPFDIVKTFLEISTVLLCGTKSRLCLLPRELLEEFIIPYALGESVMAFYHLLLPMFEKASNDQE